MPHSEQGNFELGYYQNDPLARLLKKPAWDVLSWFCHGEFFGRCNFKKTSG